MHISNHHSSHAVQKSSRPPVQTGSRWHDDVTRLDDQEQNFFLRSTGAATELMRSGCFSTKSIRCASLFSLSSLVRGSSLQLNHSIGWKKSLSVELHLILHPSFSCIAKLKRQGHMGTCFSCHQIACLHIPTFHIFIITMIKNALDIFIFF